jgi:FAD/FMN-containing dehydrogenase
MIIDVSGMNGIIIDPLKKEAIFQAGVRWGKANKELQAYELHTPGIFAYC